MCEIMEEYANEVAAKQLVFYVENAVKRLGNPETACDMIGIKVSDYNKAKNLLEKVLI